MNTVTKVYRNKNTERKHEQQFYRNYDVSTIETHRRSTKIVSYDENYKIIKITQ
jgi:hypothetical protein